MAQEEKEPQEQEKIPVTEEQDAPKAEESVKSEEKAGESASESAEAAASASNEEEKAPATPAEPTLEEQLAEMKENYLRALAELENYRKRMAREMNDTRENTRNRTLTDILGIYDLLQMAVDAARSAKDVAALRQGVEMTFGELKRTFSSLGVEPVESAGEAFDPARHQAMTTEASEEVPEGHVLRQWKPGFQRAGKLLRPAVVVVSSGPAVKPEEPQSEAPQAEDAEGKSSDAQ